MEIKKYGKQYHIIHVHVLEEGGRWYVHIEREIISRRHVAQEIIFMLTRSTRNKTHMKDADFYQSYLKVHQNNLQVNVGIKNTTQPTPFQPQCSCMFRRFYLKETSIYSM